LDKRHEFVFFSKDRFVFEPTTSSHFSNEGDNLYRLEKTPLRLD